jgi:hypothetical protein
MSTLNAFLRDARAPVWFGCLGIVSPSCIEAHGNCFPKVGFDDAGVLARIGDALVDDLAAIDVVLRARMDRSADQPASRH